VICDDWGMSRYTYDELVQFHLEMTERLSGLTAEGLVEFRVNRLQGVIEVVVRQQHDAKDLASLVGNVPSDAYTTLVTSNGGNGRRGPRRFHRK
jgi:hypothetical protein